jgi:translation elongation factor P/translation initiation factor 5A
MMQTVLPSEFKRGMVLMVGGAPEVLEEFHISGTAQNKHKLHARLRREYPKEVLSKAPPRVRTPRD